MIIVNPEVASTVAHDSASRVTNPIFKNFLSRRVRQEMVQERIIEGRPAYPGLHVPITAEEVLNMHEGGSPPMYVMQAINNNQPLYMISIESPGFQTLKQTVEHLVDWFNGMEYMLKTVDEKIKNPGEEGVTQVELEDRRLTQKAVGNLQNQTIQQALASSEAWFARMGSRLQGSKTDVIILKRWKDGFYGVQYRDTASGIRAMQSDGNDLQNCLRGNNYVPLIQAGEARVYAIRGPNDEAVVGISTDGEGRLKECKGKNNMPVSDVYATYAADFLNALKVTLGNDGDLKRAEIEYHNGRFFVFQHEAEQVLDHPNVKVWKNSHQALIQMGKSFTRFIISAGHLDLKTSLPDQNLQTRLIIGLNALNMPPMVDLASALTEIDVYYGKGQYTSGFEGASEEVYNVGGVTARKTENEIRIWSGGYQVGFMLSKGRLDSVSANLEYDSEEMPKEIIARVLSALKIAPTENGLQMMSGRKYGIDYIDGVWGEFNDIAKTFYDRDGYKTWGTQSSLYFSYEDITALADIKEKAIKSFTLMDENEQAKTDVEPEIIINMLNTVKMPPYGDDPHDNWAAGIMLFDAGIIFNGSKYVSILDASQVKYADPPIRLLAVRPVTRKGPNTEVKSIVVNDQLLWKPVQNNIYNQRYTLLNKVLNYQRFVMNSELLVKTGRRQFIKMCNAVGVVPNNKEKLIDSYGLDISGGAGKVKGIEEGKTKIFNDFYQLTDKSWLITPNDGPITTFTLRGGKLEATRHTSSYGYKNSIRLYSRAVQWIVNNNHVANAPNGSGILDTKFHQDTDEQEVTATVERLAERLKGMENASYLPFVTENSYDALHYFFSGLGKLTKKNQAILYAATKPKSPWFMIEPKHTLEINGYTIKEEIIRMPAAWIMSMQQVDKDDDIGITNPEIKERMENDLHKSAWKAIEYMKAALKIEDKKKLKIFKISLGYASSASLNKTILYRYPERDLLLEMAREVRNRVMSLVDAAEVRDQEEITAGKRMKDFTEAQIMSRYRSEVDREKWSPNVEVG